MSITVEELNNIYSNLFDEEYLQRTRALSAGLEKFYESITGSESYKQIQALKKALNDPDSSINRSIKICSGLSEKIDFEKLTGIQEGLQQFAEQMPKIDLSAFSALQILNYDKLFNSENIIGQKFSEACDYAYEMAKQEAGEPDISKEELENTVKEEIKNNTVGKAEIENSQFRIKYYKIIKFIFTNVILPLLLSLVYDLGKAQIGKMIKSSAEENAPVIYEIHNENTYVNIIDQTENLYRVYFIDEEGTPIDGYIEKENVNLDFEDEEDIN